MKIKNPLTLSNLSLGKTVLVLWVAFSVLYIGKAFYQDAIRSVYNLGSQHGAQAAIGQIMALAQKCEPVQLFNGEGENRIEINLVNPTCESAG